MEAACCCQLVTLACVDKVMAERKESAWLVRFAARAGGELEITFIIETSG